MNPENQLPENPAQAPQQFAEQQNPLPQQVYGYADSTQYHDPPKKTAKKMLTVSAIIAGVMLLLGGAGYAYVTSRPTPENVFAAAIDKSLSTRHVTQLREKEGPSKANLAFDFSVSEDPRVHRHTQATMFEQNFDVEQYASLKNSYVSYKKYMAAFEPGSPVVAFKDKWMQTRKDNKLVTDSSVGVDGFFPDAHLQFFDNWIIGNFGGADKREIKKLIFDLKVYKYDPAKVTRQTLDGREAYVYDVKFDERKRWALNKKVAESWGLDGREVADNIKSSASAYRAKLYVDIGSKRLVRTEAVTAGIIETVKYTDYDKAAIPSEPASQASYAEFVRSVEQIGASSRQ